MRFLHTADWHIGKKIQGYDLLEDQANLLQQILAIAKAEKVDAIVVAGDIYDRSVPSVEAITLINQTFEMWNLVEGFPMLVISGNHDSAIRLGTGAPWYQQTNFHLVTEFARAFTPIEMTDTQFFLLPYFEPIAARLHFNEEFTTIQEAFIRVIEEMEKQFNPEKKQVLVTHFFVAGSSRTDSETTIEVGGLANVSASILANFDYVALGHLHYKNASQAEKIKYSGSPMKFSLSEINDEKGVWIVDTIKEQRSFHPLTPLREMRQLTSSFQELLDGEALQNQRNDFWHFTLTDKVLIPNMMNQLRQIYPHILSVERSEGLISVAKTKQLRHPQKNPMMLLSDFFEEMAGEPLTTQQKKWIEEGFAVVNDDEKKEKATCSQEN